MIHEDLIDAHLNTKSVEESLQETYKTKFSETKTSLKADNPRLKNEEVEKKAAAQAKKEIKESREAKLLQHRVAMMAEENVQTSIRKAMEMFGIAVHVFRGVNTFDEIGQHLESLGIKMSRLGAFKPGGSCENTFECEHDIAAVALL